MFLLVFTRVGLGEIYVIKNPLYSPSFCHQLIQSLYLVHLSHLLFLKENSVTEVSGDKKHIFYKHLPELPCWFFYLRKWRWISITGCCGLIGNKESKWNKRVWALWGLWVPGGSARTCSPLVQPRRAGHPCSHSPPLGTGAGKWDEPWEEEQSLSCGLLLGAWLGVRVSSWGPIW